jgi:hypothetical protein
MKLSLLAFCVAVSPALAQSRPSLGPLPGRGPDDEQMYVTQRAREEAIAQVAAAAEIAERGTSPAAEQTARALSGWLEKFPTIRLIVQPAPPRDYSVAINGEDCPATERGLYKVPSGSVEVRVVRAGKPPCVWTGNLTYGRTQDVPCDF